MTADSDAVERPLAELQGEHERIEAAYVAYQTALMACDRAGAVRALAGLRQRLAAHAELEDALLMPLFAQEYAARPLEGGSPELFHAEHSKLARLAADLAAALDETPATALTPPVALALIERGFTFKHLWQHHSQREDRVFYPTVARVVGGGAPLRALWAQLDAWSRAPEW